MLLQTAHISQTELLEVQRVRQAGDETGRIRHGGLMVVMLVQADERAVVRELPHERILTALPRSEQTDHGLSTRAYRITGSSEWMYRERLASICRFHYRPIAG